jgi:hypothetical protein
MVSKDGMKLQSGLIGCEDTTCHSSTYKNNTSVAFISGAVAVFCLFTGSDIEIFSRRSVVMILIIVGRELGGGCPTGPNLDGVWVLLLVLLLGHFGIDKGLLGQRKTLAFRLGLLNDILLAQRSLSAS